MVAHKFCMGVVVYNPTITELENIEAYAGSGLFDLIMIYDNSPEKIGYSFKHPICRCKFQNENSGLAKPYNEMIVTAEQNGFDYLCIMDQDSSYNQDEIRRMQNAINIYADPSNVAAFCPVVLKKGFEDYERKKEWIEAEWCINSGTFLNISFLNSRHIKYDEAVFLDGLDYDFCWTVREQKGSIMQYRDSLMIQTFGYTTNDKQSVSHYSALRYYLITHNRKYIFKKHFGVMRGLLHAQIKNIILSLKVLFYEDNKLEKFIACYKGIIR